jgi:hypothetical protein
LIFLREVSRIPAQSKQCLAVSVQVLHSHSEHAFEQPE